MAPLQQTSAVDSRSGDRALARRLALGGLLSLAVALGIGRFIYTPILPPMSQALALAKGEAGMIASANFAGYLVGALMSAAFDARASARRWLLGALAVSALSTAATALPSDLAGFLLLRFIAGAASALVMVFASTLVLERLAMAGQDRLFSWHFAGVGIGIAAAAALVAILVTIGAEWRLLWLAGGALALACLPAVLLLVPAAAPQRIVAAPPATGTPARAVRRLILAYGLFGLGYSVTATFIVDMVHNAPGLRPLQSTIWVAVGLAAVPSVALWSALAARIGLLRSYALASLAEAIGVAASVLLPNIAGALLAALLLGGTFVAITALGLTAARQLSPQRPQRSLGLMTAAFGLGQIIGPAAAGLAFDSLGSFLVPSLVAAAGLALGTALTWPRPPGSERQTG